jgi:AraC-like DNA-binding protein
MAVTRRVVASGPGWQVGDVICTSGPQDRPFEERHAGVSIGAVTEGTFQYRTRQGSALLVPGALRLGTPGACFECGHEHAAGDRCLAFHMTPAFLESAGVHLRTFSLPSLPPLPQLTPILAAAEAARDDGDADAFEELALRLAGAVAAQLTPKRPHLRRVSARDEKRISSAVRRIEAHAHRVLSLATLAREAAVSRYHFLRTFAQVTGMTPHQFVLRTRLNRAAVRLRRSNDAISAIAFGAGFNDLSTFNRRFRRLMGSNPGDFRERLTAAAPRA